MCSCKERWKTIRQSPFYEISSRGAFRSKARAVNYKDGRKRVHGGDVVKPYLSQDGYHRVRTKRNGKVKHYFVHRLVAEAFVFNKKKVETVDHIDNDKNNNCACNLQWLTRSQNSKKRAFDGVAAINYGNAKINFETAEDIRKLFKEGVGRKALQEKFSLSKASISKIIRNETWTKKNDNT